MLFSPGYLVDFSPGRTSWCKLVLSDSAFGYVEQADPFTTPRSVAFEPPVLFLKCEHGTVDVFPAHDLPRHKERFSRLLTSRSRFAQPGIALNPLLRPGPLALCWVSLPVTVPKCFSDHLFAGLQVFPGSYGHFSCSWLYNLLSIIL